VDRNNLARNLRQRSTDAEQLLWYRLRNRRLAGHKFRRQQAIQSYFVDFICHESRLVIELDGGQHVLQEEQDEARSAVIHREGYRVLRFWNDQVLTELDSVLEVILQSLVEPAYPSPQPSPTRGEGVGERTR
jgi:very-short-patch-repair endonuclease